MTTKTISIMDDAYRLLFMNKLSGESFSDVIRRVFGKSGGVMEFAGALSLSEVEASNIKKTILKSRETSTGELLKDDIYR